MGPSGTCGSFTKSMGVQVDLTITPDFLWDEKVHGAKQNIWQLHAKLLVRSEARACVQVDLTITPDFLWDEG